MGIGVFLSYPKPFLKEQEEFIDMMINYLKGRGVEPRTLGVTDYDMDAPLIAIRKLMAKSSGLITVAFRRNFIKRGEIRPNSDLGQASKKIFEEWTTSPYCQIEPAMAFQMDLPILVLREKGVMEEGILEKGATGTYLTEFELGKSGTVYLESEEWSQLIRQWEGYVRNKFEKNRK